MSECHRHPPRRRTAAAIPSLRSGPGRSACRRSRGSGRAFHAGLRAGVRRARRRDRGDRRQSGAADLRKHHRRAGEQRPRAAPRRRRVRPTGRHRQQRRAARHRARDLAARRRALGQDADERGAVRAHRCAAPRERDSLGLTAEQARVLERYHTSHRRSGAALDADSASAGSPRSPSGSPRSAPRSARTCWPTSSPMRWCSKARTSSPACRISSARRRAPPPRSAACRQARHHAAALQRRAVPAILVAPRPAREGVPRLAEPRRQQRQVRQQGDHRRDRARCAPSAPSCSAIRPSRIIGSTTPWRRRRRTVRALLEKVWAPARKRALADRDAMQEIVREEGGNFALAPWDWRYYAEKLRKRRCDIDEASVKPYMQLDNVIEAAFYAANRLFGLTFTPRRRAGLASGRARLGGERRGRRPCRPVLRRLFRAAVQAERRLDGHAARPGEACAATSGRSSST